MSTNPPMPDRAQTGPTDADLAHLVAGLAGPVGDLLGHLSTAAVSLLRAMLDEAYERGRRDALTAAIHRRGTAADTVMMRLPHPGIVVEQLPTLARPRTAAR